MGQAALSGRNVLGASSVPGKAAMDGRILQELRAMLATVGLFAPTKSCVLMSATG
jgi:hypothetical protein